MRIYGIDFTSRPSRRKPITCLSGRLDGDRLVANELSEWPHFAAFEDLLCQPGPWIAGLDFPFGQARRFVENIGWPHNWSDYIDRLDGMPREAFRDLLDGYRMSRPSGDKEHRRRTDEAAGAISPQKLYGTPVAMMFFEGAPRLQAAGVHIPGLRDGDPDRVVVEAYPGMLARQLIGRRSYKQDSRRAQTREQQTARQALFDAVVGGGLPESYGFTVRAPAGLAIDPAGDQLDALLCLVQAAWSWRRREHNYGLPERLDPVEGWIVTADPGRS
jgi:hypothetical protein